MSDPTAPTDPLAALREQIRATTDAAERLAAETAGARAQEVPPAGWATPDDQAARQQELQALVALVEALRELVPAELKDQVRDVLRQLLLLTRALIDWWVERMDEAGAPRTAEDPDRVQDIPIT
ncbi:MAG: hypothetical protein JWO90_2556 [Solirubrobacterales bacterium]|jgi:hypothetical protein|nr:hypothetical protein [Solirubrobacterales bacterium]